MRMPASGRNKYHKTQYVSPAAKEKIENKKWGGLVWEHCVPKQKYIQEPCERLAKKGELTLEFVLDLLNRNWKTATITKEEDGRLRRTSMRANWNGKDPFDRYTEAKIELLDNPNYTAPGELRIVGPLERMGGE
jgi:hypothetical protein